jgi:two-component system, LuxR family, sensor kinase FixL
MGHDAFTDGRKGFRAPAHGMDAAHADDIRHQEEADKDRSAGIDAMGAALSHELNQPLTALMIYLQSLQRQVRGDAIATPSNVRELTDKAVGEAERAIEIVRRMRRMSTRPEPDRHPVDVNALVVETTRAVIVGGKWVANIRHELAPDLPIILADQVQIRQIMLNLLRNAAEACGKVRRPEISVSTAAVGASVIVTVADNGPGVPPSIAGTLFRAFETRKSQGQGIGLAISRMIAQNHGGDLYLDSRASAKGAVFSLRLPLR